MAANSGNASPSECRHAIAANTIAIHVIPSTTAVNSGTTPHRSSTCPATRNPSGAASVFAEMAAADPTAGGNPVKAGVPEMRKMYEAAVAGRL